jgi:uncharacterized phage-associated protein
MYKVGHMPISPELEGVQQAIIEAHRKLFDESPSPMKLQKLCYYAQAYSLAEGQELFPEDFQAWQHGPVIPDLYKEYKEYQWRAIDKNFSAPTNEAPELVTEVVAAYGRLDGAALSNMTHKEAPWVDARGDIPESEGSRELINKDSIKTFFAHKLKNGG